MKIKHINFSEGVHYFELNKSVEDLNLSEPFIGEVVLKCKMDKSHNQIIIGCDLSFDGNFECDRCAKDYSQKIETHFTSIYMVAKDTEENGENENIHYITPETIYLDLSDDVIEYATLALPMKNLCKEDCKGLCTKCGKNLNDGNCDCKDDEINPIWSDLLKLKDKL